MQNNISYTQIKKYVEGKMTSTEKNTFEKEASENHMLQDAIDGYQENTSGLEHFDKIKPIHSGINRNTKLITLALLLIGVVWIVKFNYKSSEIITNPVISSTHSDSIYNEVEILPLALDTLINITQNEQIQQNTLTFDHKSNPKFDKSNYKPEKVTVDPKNNDKIDILDINPIDIENEEVFVITNPKKIYPFVYFHDLAVVDYTRFENRTKTIQKTKYVYSGLSANHESEDAKENMEMTEQIVDVSYMEYLEESMWYFSKEKYKNALKRFDIIAGQYKNDLNALFYGGLSNYNLGRFEFALKNFTAIVDLGNSPFYEDAEWYKVKTEIKLGKINNAKYNLQSIISEGGYYAKDAILLLKKL